VEGKSTIRCTKSTDQQPSALPTQVSVNDWLPTIQSAGSAPWCWSYGRMRSTLYRHLLNEIRTNSNIPLVLSRIQALTIHLDWLIEYNGISITCGKRFTWKKLY
jgi:hypothetical protein